jgi:hypothetical protein
MAVALGLLLAAAAFASPALADPTTITTVPGTIEDASSTRVLYRTTDGHLVIRDVADPGNPSDEDVPLPAGRKLASPETARLVPGGALYVTLPAGTYASPHIHEWRGGVTTDLGEINSEHSIVVAGNYAIWNDWGVLVRREFTSPATNVTIATDAGYNDNDVAANGDVVYWGYPGYEVHRWRNGVATTLTASGADWSVLPRTDGSTTVYRRNPPCCDPGAEILFSDGTTETPILDSQNTELDPSIYGPYPDRSYRVNAGWIAYTGAEGRQVRTRAPDGTFTDVAPASTSAIYLTGLSPAGQVTYQRYDSDAWRLFLGSGSAPAFPVGTQPCCSNRFGWRTFWSGGHWYVIDPNSLTRLGVDTAIPAQPPEFDTHDVAHFEFASIAPDPAFTCTLDGQPLACGASVQTPTLDDGQHTLTVTSTDQGTSEADPTPATATWTVDTSPPDAFALSAPADGGAVANATPALSWQSATDPGSGIASYKVKIDGQPAGTKGPDETTFTPAAALADGTHTWQVLATNGAGLERASATSTFTVDTAEPSAPALDAPADGAASSSGRPTLTWNQSTDAGSGIAGYDVEIDGAATRVANGTGSFTPSTDLGDGAHSWRVVAVDAAGNRASSPLRALTVDTRLPTAHLSATPNPALTGDSVQFDASATSAGGAPLASYEWDLDGNGSYETSTGASAIADRTYDTPADLQIGVRVTDTAGRVGTDHVLLHVTPAPLPGLPGVSINDGDQYTNDPHVTITARWPHFATSILASNDGGFAGADPFPVTSSFAWQLASSGAERLPKTVYVRFQGGLAGNETYSDDIILDETAPQVVTATLKRTGAVRSAAARHRYVAHLRGRDGGSGLASLQVTANRAHPGPRYRYVRTLVLSTTQSPRWARVVDRAGNRSRWRALKLLQP